MSDADAGTAASTARFAGPRLSAGGPGADDEGRPDACARCLPRAGSGTAATEPASGEPPHGHGLRALTVPPWQLRRARFAVHIDSSQQTGGIGGPPAPPENERGTR